jgi:hypothetical protein
MQNVTFDRRPRRGLVHVEIGAPSDFDTARFPRLIRDHEASKDDPRRSQQKNDRPAI